MPREVRAILEQYRDAFNALDGRAVAELYAEPSGIAQDGVYTYWPERAAVEKNMTALCKIYKDKGFRHAGFELCQYIGQGDKYAVADIQWKIDWSTGQEAWTFKTTYNLVRTEQGWRVLLCTAYSEAALHRAAMSDRADG